MIHEISLGNNATIRVDDATLTQDIQHYLMGYALSVISQRAHAGLVDDKEKEAAARKRIQRLVAGELPSAGGGGPRLSPLEVECRSAFISWVMAKGWKRGQAEAAAKTWQAFLRERLKDRADAVIATITATAEANLKAVKAVDVDIDLGAAPKAAKKKGA